MFLRIKIKNKLKSIFCEHNWSITCYDWFGEELSTCLKCSKDIKRQLTDEDN